MDESTDAFICAKDDAVSQVPARFVFYFDTFGIEGLPVDNDSVLVDEDLIKIKLRIWGNYKAVEAVNYQTTKAIHHLLKLSLATISHGEANMKPNPAIPPLIVR